MQTIPSQRRLSRPLVWAVLLGALALVLASLLPPAAFGWGWDRLNIFAAVFLGIFIEAVPYLLLGTLASGLVEVFVDRERMSRWISGRPAAAAVGGAFMGLVFPVCECGVVPLTRRLFHKGLPLSAGVAFLLAAPVLNPVVILSTAAAFGWGRMLLWRMLVSLTIAVTVGLVFSAEPQAGNVLRPAQAAFHVHADAGGSKRLSQRLRAALVITADEFFEMGRYLIAGAALSAGLQTFIPQSALLAVGGGPLLSVLVMLGLAVLLSVCSTVDAFVALGFVGTFSFGSVLSFLTFGPMVDIKSVILYSRVFRRRPVAYLVLIPFLMSLTAGLIFNTLLPWGA